MHQAAEALALHVDGILADGAELPIPSAPNATMPDWLADEPGVEQWVRVLIPVNV